MDAISILYQDGSSIILRDIEIPDECPLCHSGIHPKYQYAFCDRARYKKKNCLQVVFKCPRKECGNLFIGYYVSIDTDLPKCRKFMLTDMRPKDKTESRFSYIIENISNNFCTIYNQAMVAESYELSEICGAGYRKALEFLVKDYLIKLHPKKEEEIKKNYLASCIKEYIEDPRVRLVAERAVWLGNDEVHYSRKWEKKDLADLKRLIKLTVNWIEMEQMTKDVKIEMPVSKS